MSEPKQTSWESDVGTVTVITEQGANETEAEWCARHEARVATWMEVFPEV